ncbi:MAG TPA: DUF2127 domain-containing protein [Thermoleophilaceae bacterium]
MADRPPARRRLGRRHRPPPGTTRPARFRPPFHWELLVCGTRGHELVGCDAARFRAEDAIVAFERDGVRWHRCLRCDSWLPLPPPRAPARELPPERDQVELPLRGKPLRDKIVLRAVAVNRALHFVGLALLGVAIFLFAQHQTELKDAFYRVVADFQGTVGGGPVQTHETGVLHTLDELFTLEEGTLHLVGAAVLVYAVIEGVEAVGLWYQRRWAEYLTLVVTASLLPLEVYELIHKLSPFKVVALIVNLAIVAYLLFAKRLFGIRGGAAADERERERDVGWHALEASGPHALTPGG